LLAADIRKGFIVMGASAGAQLAAVTARRARDDLFFADHPLTGQVLQIPMTCHPDAYPDQSCLPLRYSRLCAYRFI
jgi:acetyl esterase/lipase